MVDFLDLLGQAEGGLDGLVLDASPPSSAGGLLRLRQSHHLLARRLAEGADAVAAGALAGYAPGTVKKLQADPLFQELVDFYKGQIEVFVISHEDRIAALAGSMLDELQHRLEETPEKFTITELRKTAESLLDRSIAPPKGRSGAGAFGAPQAVAVEITFVGAQPPQGAVSARPVGGEARPLLELEAEPTQR